MLFRQGPLPGPKLIMEYQQGKLHDTELEAAWEESLKSMAAVERRFDRVRYPCGVCDSGLMPTAYVTHFPGVDLPIQKAQEHVLDRGACRQCLSCVNRFSTGGGKVLCLVCDQRLPEDAYEPKKRSAFWKERSFTKSLCLACQAKGTALPSKRFRCRRCRSLYHH